MRDIIESFEEVQMVGLSRYDEVYKQLDKILTMMEERTITQQDGIDMLHYTISYYFLGGFCNRGEQ